MATPTAKSPNPHLMVLTWIAALGGVLAQRPAGGEEAQ